MGLRAKIGIAIAATAAVVAVLVGVLVHNRTVDAQFDLAAESIDGRLQSLVQDRAAGVDSGRAIVNPPDLPGPLEAAVRHGKRGVYLEPDGPKPHLWAATELDGDIIALKRPYVREQETLRSLDRVLWMSGIAGTALGCVVGLLVAHRLGRRLTASAATAQRIAEGDLTARLPLGGKDEIAQLTSAVNTMADALAARLQAERDVTANIAHELRTPVAGLVAAAGLLPPSRPTELVQDRAQHVRSLMEDVLEVARLDARTEEADTELRPLGELARRTVRAMGAGSGIGSGAGAGAGGAAGGSGQDGDGGVRRAVEIRVLSDALVETDPRRVERILVNLISNALRHGAAPVTIEVERGVLRVRDSGPGFPETLLAHGPQRFRTGGGSDGHGLGLGLTIASGQARVLGARLTFANPEGGGAEATLDLSEALRTEEDPESGRGPERAGPTDESFGRGGGKTGGDGTDRARDRGMGRGRGRDRTSSDRP
ncbi:sensor histidine kinase [Streptomyces albofaciens JCM 4342]|uniref:sensor histidine kinase n=1 Tax=Streptomyces albofaciens TaxID=66866 RepID=UPI00123B40CC|nr:HAMP domain-containing sensor histidine kinase [Streptomyces albofaciens]KAA6221363.1 sensor histidine kinase [Streptomyces albofaciens JCM 4342]